MYVEPEKYHFQGNLQCFNQFNHSCITVGVSSQVKFSTKVVFIFLSLQLCKLECAMMNNFWVMIIQNIFLFLYLLFFFQENLECSFQFFLCPIAWNSFIQCPLVPALLLCPCFSFLPHRGWGFTAPAQMHGAYYCIIGHAAKTGGHSGKFQPLGSKQDHYCFLNVFFIPWHIWSH